MNDAILKKGRFSNSIFKKQNETPLWQTLAYQNIIHRLPWWFRGSDSVLPAQEVWVQSLARGPRLHTPHVCCAQPLRRVWLCDPRTVARRLVCPWGLSTQEYWSGLPCPPPGIFPTQGWKLGLPHCRRILYHLSHQGSPHATCVAKNFLKIRKTNTSFRLRKSQLSNCPPKAWEHSYTY